MRKFLLSLLTVVSVVMVSAQTTPTMDEIKKQTDDFRPRLGLKVGYNWSYLTGNAQGFKKENNNGFMIGAFYAPPSKGFGFRTEVIFSRQGYSFDDGGKNTDVKNDYIYLPQLTTYTIAKKSTAAGRCANRLSVESQDVDRFTGYDHHGFDEPV